MYKKSGSNGKIYSSIKDLRKHLQTVYDKDHKIVTTSGGFDPLHIGHLRCIQEASTLGDVCVIIVNGDGFLTRKKGQPFMNLDERMEIISAIKGVDYVVSWDDGSQTVAGALEILSPDIFAKGGDRSSPEKVPEFYVCDKIGCEVVFNVGGGKIQSSSELIERSLGDTDDKR